MDMKMLIIALRSRNNMTQAAFAEKLFVTRQAVSRWENGESIPNIDTLKLISEKFGVSMDTL
jgi:transcriptional regulator with XRE-family HTH domain